MRSVLIVTALLFGSACGPLAQNEALVSGFNGLLKDSRVVQREDTEETLAGIQVSVGSGNALLFSPVEEVDPSYLFRVSRNDDMITWVSREGVSLTLVDGIVVATRGLGDDLMGADLTGVDQAVSRGNGTSTRIHDYMSGEDKVVRRVYRCEVSTVRNEVVTIFEHDREVRLVREACSGSTGSFTNLYWIDSVGKVWQSRQWISARVGMVDMQSV